MNIWPGTCRAFSLPVDGNTLITKSDILFMGRLWYNSGSMNKTVFKLWGYDYGSKI